MILQALAVYFERLLKEGKAAPPGFQNKPIPFIISIGRDGRFLGLTDTTSADTRKGIPRLVPREVVRPGTKSWHKANLLWDNPAYVLGYSEADPVDAAKKHATFINTIREYLPGSETDEGISAVLAFLERRDFSEVFKHPAWQSVRLSGGNITFQLEDDYGLVCQRQAVIDTIAAVDSTLEGQKVQCLVSGVLDQPILTTHGKIKGVKNSQTSGASLVSFNLDAFGSYGKQQCANAIVGKKAEFAYVTALNTMLSGSSQRVQVGYATMVFWAERKHEFERVFFDLFGAEPPKGEPEHDYRRLLAMFRSPKDVTRPVELDPDVKFYVLGLAPNAARIAVRFWYSGTVGEVVANIGLHFNDLEMVKGPKDWHKIGLRWLLRATARQGKNLLEWDKNIAPNLAGDTMKAILTGAPYPRTLLAAAINRIKAEQSTKDVSGNVTYTRAALLKAILVRDTRYHTRNEKEVDMSLDASNTNPGYLLGRLFAVLEKTQESANPGLNTTIRDTFYSAASGTPVTVYPRLMRLKNHHIAKIENKGQVVNIEKQIGEIMSKLTAGDPFPVYLTLPDQGRFAVGYYHQRQEFFTRKEKGPEKEEASNE